MDNQPDTPSVAPARRRRLLGLLVGLAVVVFALDQATKYLAEQRLIPGTLTPLVGDLLGLQLVHNPGAAFSLATGMTWIFTIVSVVVVVVVVRISRRLGSLGWALALGLLLGGCLGNLCDRLLRAPGFAVGHVVDFISYAGYFVGNVADIAIVGAAVLVALLAVLGREVDGTRAHHRAREDAGHAEGSGDDAAPREALGPDDGAAEARGGSAHA